MSTNRIRFARLPVTFGLLAACACTTGCAGAPIERVDGLESRAHATRSFVTAADLRTFAVDESLFESLHRIRPEMFTASARVVRPDPAERFAVVYLDGVRQGNLSTLQSIPSRVAKEVEYLTAVAAQNRYGRFHAGGVIDVRTH